MSILKVKIAKIRSKYAENSPSFSNKETQSDLSEESENRNKLSHSPFKLIDVNNDSLSIISSPPALNIRLRKNSINSQEHKASSNIMKNYCRGITNFASSFMAVPYLLPLLKKHQIDLETFRKFIQAKKSKINCIKQLRGMLLVMPNDKEQVAAMKEVFKEITIVFLKYFVPNWIYNTKIVGKYEHLKYRFKILRRVKEPHYFTYLQGFDQS